MKITSLFEKLFSETGIFAPFRETLQGKWKFLSFLSLVLIGIFSALFVFFADRNDETVVWGKVFLKTIIALAVGGAVLWISSYRLSLFWSSIIALVIGAIAFLSLSNI